MIVVIAISVTPFGIDNYPNTVSGFVLLQEVRRENKVLRETVAGFERVKRAFGPEEVEKAVEDAKRREAAEKEQRRAKRKFSRGVSKILLEEKI